MGNVVAQHIPNCDTRLIKAGEPLQSSHAGWLSTRTFTTTALCAIGTAAEVARLFVFFFKAVDIHLGMYVLPAFWNRNMKQLSLTKLLQDQFLNTPNSKGRDK